MMILELKTGLFPDADTVSTAVQTLAHVHTVDRWDITSLSKDDEGGWAMVATAILTADLVVTL